MIFSAERQAVIDTGKKLDRYGLIALSGGNVSLRMSSGEILVTPSGLVYDDLDPSDILVVDIHGKIIDGKRKPSVDTEALLYIFQKKPTVNAVIHTHQPYATALGLVEDEVVCNLTTLANATRGSVNVAPYSSAASLDMGVKSVEYLGDKLAVILKHHGVVTVGDSLKQALYACVYLEEAAKTIIAAKSCNRDLALMTDDEITAAVKVFDNYGQ